MSLEGNKYILDSNVFIEAFQRYYSFDIAPSFWDFLRDNCAKQSFIVIDKVYDELIKRNDMLSEWVQKELTNKIVKTNDDYALLLKYSLVIKWAFTQTQFLPKAKDDFAEANSADAWIVAMALVKDYVIVTHEVYNKEIKKKIPIPNVCRAFNIEYINTFDLLREMNFKF